MLDRVLTTPLIINFFGEPCAGKSVAAMRVATELKVRGVAAELVTEYAKDLTWEKRHVALACQPYVTGKQLRNVERLTGSVDVIITDSPILLTSFYAQFNTPGRYPPSFHDFVLDQFTALRGLNFLVRRVGPYQHFGRTQNEAEAEEVARRLREFLTAKCVFPEEVARDQVVSVVIPATLAELSRLKAEDAGREP